MDNQKPIELYFWRTPNGQKICICLEEMGIPYKVKYIDITKGEQFTPEYLTISPNNKIPAIVDSNMDDGRPISIFESGAILQYLGRKTGQFYPNDLRARVEVEEWLFWQVGGLGPMAGQAHHFRVFAKEKIAYGIERYTKEVSRLYGVMDKRLQEREYLAREYSIADMACYPWIASHEKQGQSLDQYPSLQEWFNRMSERPAVKKAMKVGTDEE